MVIRIVFLSYLLCSFFEESGDRCMIAHLKETVSISVYKNLSTLKSFINHES